MSDALSALDNLPKIRQFDAFPKTESTYTVRSRRGGFLTLFLTCLLLLFVWHDLGEYLYGDVGYVFDVDKNIGHDMQVNVDMTVAMPCHYLTVDVRDAVGDRLHISDEFKKDGTSFHIGQARQMKDQRESGLSASRIIRDARSGQSWLNRTPKFERTYRLIEEGPACRIYGSVDVKKVTGNLHITTLGHGYMSFEHTDHKLINLSHVIHEFSFGPYFPHIIQPLDDSVEITDQHFHAAQYFLSVVPTKYVDPWGSVLHTNQYSVTDYQKDIIHGRGVPGIFFKYDLEPLMVTVHERTTTLIQFLTRVTGVIGGVFVCTSFAYRVYLRLLQMAGQEKVHVSGYGTSIPTHASVVPSSPPIISPTSSSHNHWRGAGAGAGGTPVGPGPGWGSGPYGHAAQDSAPSPVAWAGSPSPGGGGQTQFATATATASGASPSSPSLSPYVPGFGPGPGPSPGSPAVGGLPSPPSYERATSWRGQGQGQGQGSL